MECEAKSHAEVEFIGDIRGRHYKGVVLASSEQRALYTCLVQFRS